MLAAKTESSSTSLNKFCARQREIRDKEESIVYPIPIVRTTFSCYWSHEDRATEEENLARGQWVKLN